MGVLVTSAASLRASFQFTGRRGDACVVSKRLRSTRVAVEARARPVRFSSNAATETSVSTVDGDVGRRGAVLGGAALALGTLVPGPANATPPRAQFQIPESDFQNIPGTDPPILFYDLKGAPDAEDAVKSGQRVAVHFDVKYRRLTVATSRQGMGVTGGSPYGFQVGVPAGTAGGPFIKALNEGIKGMSPGQLRRLIVPPEYAYGNFQVQEIPPNATLTIDLEMLTVVNKDYLR
mmetsp:Transcript_21592/g.34969  ORF Transcript_21592/g.34969 Transcript_21592/m.34969 type:complete len:234 (+) Transcript_21592:118-819(+)